MNARTDPHDVANGGHEPVDVDPFIPTGQCAVCQGVAVDDRPPEDRSPDNPYNPDPSTEGEPA